MKLVQLIGVALFASAGVAMANEGNHDATTSSSTSSTKSQTSETWKAAGSDFDTLDKNGDGYLSKTEAQDKVTDYGIADRNADGRLDRSEFSAMELKGHSATKTETMHESSDTMHAPSNTTSDPTTP
jgi:hypothetical protein